MLEFHRSGINILFNWGVKHKVEFNVTKALVRAMTTTSTRQC